MLQSKLGVVLGWRVNVHMDKYVDLPWLDVCAKEATSNGEWIPLNLLRGKWNHVCHWASCERQGSSATTCNRKIDGTWKDSRSSLEADRVDSPLWESSDTGHLFVCFKLWLSWLLLVCISTCQQSSRRNAAGQSTSIVAQLIHILILRKLARPIAHLEQTLRYYVWRNRIVLWSSWLPMERFEWLTR